MRGNLLGLGLVMLGIIVLVISATGRQGAVGAALRGSGTSTTTSGTGSPGYTDITLNASGHTGGTPL